MKITFLGTAAGIPEKDRDCTSTMIETGGKIYLVDVGAPVVNKLVDSGKNIEDIKAVFITHCHGDHVYGLRDLIRVVNNANIFKSASLDYYIPEQTLVNAIKDYFAAVIKKIREDVNRFHVFFEGVIFEDENVKVTAVKNAHMEKRKRPSYSLIIEAEGKKVVFSGDLSQNLSKNDFPEIAIRENVDALVLEFAHINKESLTRQLDKCIAKKLILNHISRYEEKRPERSGRTHKPRHDETS